MKRPSKCPKRGGYITLQDWMVRHYHLYGRELILYAVIQSFSQDGDSFFTGSINYLSFWTGFSKPTVIKYLKQLVSDGLIMKEEIWEMANIIRRIQTLLCFLRNLMICCFHFVYF